MVLNKEKGKSRGNEDEHRLDYSSIQLNPNWNKFDILVEVAVVASKQLEKEEKERIALEEKEKEKERKIGRNLSTFLKIHHKKETVESDTGNGSDGIANIQLPGDKIDFIVNFTKGKRTLGKKRPRSPNDEKEQSNFKKSAKKPRHDLNLLSTSSLIPDEVRNRIVQIGGSEESITFVFQKVLTNTDISKHSSRLLVPFKKIKNEGFLTEEEKDCFVRDPEFGIDAIFVDPALNEGRMKLRKWKMRKTDNVSYYYALISQWTEVVENNHFQEGMKVELWAFRRDSHLGLALVKV